MRWGPFQTGEIKESEPSDIDNYEITIFCESSLLLVPTAFFWHPWFRLHIKHCSQKQSWFWIWAQSILSFDGASLHVARAQQALKARVCVEGSRGMFPWKTLKFRASEITRNEFISTNSEINFYPTFIIVLLVS